MPPVGLAVKVTADPTVPVVGPEIVTASVRGAIATVAEFVAVRAGDELSVAVTLIETLPLTLYIVVKLAPVPLDGVPPVAVQANVTGGVPPFDVALQATGLLTVPVVGQVIVTDRAPGLIATVADAVAVFAFASVTVTLTVLEPDVANIVVKVALVPLAGVPPVAAQAKVYGVVPPVGLAVNVSGVLIPPVVGPLTVTARTSAATVTVAEFVAVTAGEALSVAVTLIETVPLALYIVAKLAPVPVDGFPPVAVQANVTGGVPPLEVAEQFTGLPTVPVVGQLIDTVRIAGLIATVTDAVAVFAFPSVTVTLTVFDPDVANIVVKPDPVPLAGVPPVAVQANV